MRSIVAVAVCTLLTACDRVPDESWSANRDASLEELLAARNTNRLYDGAPPVIPHEVAALGRENCLNCHTPGAYDNPDRVAPPRSHPSWGDCRQCHVERRATTVSVRNTIEPLRWPATGHRQTALSPPVIPHHIENREDCPICHIGAQAPPALRAAHGYRPQCRQCHLGKRKRVMP